MKNLLNISIILLLALGSCSKQKRTERKLSGIWNINEYHYTTPAGLSYYPEVTGSIFFSANDEAPSTYSMDISYSHPVISGDRTEAGTYHLNSSGERLTMTPIILSVSQQPLIHEISILTNHELKLVYVDSNGYQHVYIFEQ